MPYTSNEKPTGLDALTTLDQSDVHVVGDVSDNGRAKKITENNLEDTIANSVNFVDELVQNTYFTTSLANDNNFITELTNNSTFQNNVNNFVTVSGGGGIGGGKPKSYQIRHLIEQDAIGVLPAGLNGYQDREFYVAQVINASGAPLVNYAIVEAPGLSRTVVDPSLTAIDYHRIEGYVVLGDYLYICVHNTTAGNATRVYRYTISDLSIAPTLMTIAAQAFGTNEFSMTSDGTYFYFTRNAGSSANAYIIAKYSLSGTTLTYISNVTLVGTPTVKGFAVLGNGTYIVMDTTVLRQFNSSGTLLESTSGYSDDYEPLVNFTDTIYVGLIDNLYTDSATTYLDFVKINFEGEEEVSLSNLPKSVSFDAFFDNAGSEFGASINGYSDVESYIIAQSDDLQKLVVDIPSFYPRELISTTIWASAEPFLGFAVIGSYIYFLLRDDGAPALRVYRVQKNDFTVFDLMTVAGQAFGTTEINIIMTSDGTYLYFTADAGTSANKYEIAKYSISGTTITYVSTTNLAGSPTQIDGLAVTPLGGYIRGDLDSTFPSDLEFYNSSGTSVATYTRLGQFFGVLINIGGNIYVGKTDNIGADPTTSHPQWYKIGYDN